MWYLVKLVFAWALLADDQARKLPVRQPSVRAQLRQRSGRSDGYSSSPGISSWLMACP
jgi:hypothetical protein